MDFATYHKKSQDDEADPDAEMLAAALAQAPSRAGAYGGQDTPDSVGAAPIPNATPMTPAAPTPSWVNMTQSGGGGKKRYGGPMRPALFDIGAADKHRQDLASMLDPARIGGIQSQMQGLSELQDSYDKARAKTPDVNMSALLGLSDAWNGGNLSKNYQQPLRQDDLDKMANDLQVKLQGARQGLTEDEVNLLKAQLGAEEKNVDTKTRYNEMLNATYEKEADRYAISQDNALNRAAFTDARKAGQISDKQDQRYLDGENRMRGGKGAPQNFTKAQNALVRVQNAQGIVPKNADGTYNYNNPSLGMSHLLDVELDGIANQGSPTVSGIDGLSAPATATAVAKIKQLFVDKDGELPEANLGPYIKAKMDYLNELGGIATKVIRDDQRHVLDTLYNPKVQLIGQIHKEAILHDHPDLLQAGDVYEGMRFKGGDPSNVKDNWEAVK